MKESSRKRLSINQVVEEMWGETVQNTAPHKQRRNL